MVKISHRERVNLALKNQNTDYVPMDFSAEPEVWEKLQKFFKVETPFQVLEKLDVDCRIISYDWQVFCRPEKRSSEEISNPHSRWKHWISDDVFEDVWGARRKLLSNEFGVHECLFGYKLADAKSIEDLQKYNWPKPGWWNFDCLDKVLDKINPNQEYHLRYRIGSIFETAWSLRGLDNMLMDLAVNPNLACYIMDRITEVHLENLRTVLDKAADKIDMVYSYDDLAQQNSTLMSRDMWMSTIALRQKKLFDLATKYNKPVMYHTCGDIKTLIKDLSEIGVDLLNPVQTSALKMNFRQIKNEYGQMVAFHGGIDIQQLLPNGSLDQVKSEIALAKQYLGRDGGYILAPTHHIQADTPLENILAIYEM